jgi:hypothetical protein
MAKNKPSERVREASLTTTRGNETTRIIYPETNEVGTILDELDERLKKVEELIKKD